MTKTQRAELSFAIRTAGLSATEQRMVLLAVLRKAARPLSVEHIAARVRGAVNTATLYRSLTQFVAAGLAARIDLGENHALYEARTEHHHHLVCNSCGTVTDVSVCIPKAMTTQILRNAPRFSSVHQHSLEFFGTCTACA